MTPAGKVCLEQEIFAGRANDDLGVYIFSVGKLKSPMTKHQLDRDYEESEQARVKYEQSRHKLRTHIATHGC